MADILDAEGKEIIITKALPENFALHEQEIRDLLCSGWSPPRIHTHLRKDRQVLVPIQDIRDYLESIPVSEILDVSVLQERYLNLDIQVDAMGELARLLRLISDRLGQALLIEKIRKERIPYVDVATEKYWAMLKDYVTLQQSLGDLPIKGATKELPATVSQLVSGDPLPTLRALMIEMTGVTTTPNKRG